MNLFIVMFLGGLWHGAAWSYAIWGTFHGGALAVERFLKSRISLPRHWSIDAIQMLVVFSFVTLAWLLFKLPKFEQAIRYFQALGNIHEPTRYVIVASVLTFSAPVVLYYLWHVARERGVLQVQRYEFLIFGALLVAIVLNSGSPQKFIYFQF